MWIALFTSESSDHYLVGPFNKKPTQNECAEVFRKQYEEEAEYSYDQVGCRFIIVQLGDEPEVITV